MKQRKIKILIPLIALAVYGVVVLLERYGVSYNGRAMGILPAGEALLFTDPVTERADCLVLVDESDDTSKAMSDIMEFVLDEMRVVYIEKDIDAFEAGTDLAGMENLVVTFEDWDLLKDQIQSVNKWVQGGGSMMNVVTPEPNQVFKLMSQKLGVTESDFTYTEIRGLQILDHAMIGSGDDLIFPLGEEDEALLTSLSVVVDDNRAKVYVQSSDGQVPILWTANYGQGRYVFLNDIITGKIQRGFLATAYSLMQDACIYPVINGSAYYLDDFPSPVPSGNAEYITRDYGLDISSFYSSIWWPAVMRWESDYGIRHTGMIIEEYSEQVKAPFVQNKDVTQFTMFGNMLLNRGGELGFHGYNHMPLGIRGVDDDIQFGDYELWEDYDSMVESIRELERFSRNLFPTQPCSVYVPPSNILSENGKRAMLEGSSHVNIIASTYFPSNEANAYVQEFEVDGDGVIHTPRVTSGAVIDDYQRLAAMSELNLHFVQSHFMHPDDCLDEDRGADLGWEEMKRTFTAYLDWIGSSAPGIRQLTGSEMGTAVSVYDHLSVQRSVTEDAVKVSLGGFSGEAYLMLRVNEGTPGKATGCSYEKVTDRMYLVHAIQPEFEIELQTGD